MRFQQPEVSFFILLQQTGMDKLGDLTDIWDQVFYQFGFPVYFR